MADAGELTEKRKEMLKKKAEVEIAKLRIKADELQIRKLEIEEDLEILDRKIKEVEVLIKEKQKELK